VNKTFLASCLLASMIVLTGSVSLAYPTDEYERTKIRRLQWQYEIDNEGRRGRKMVPGGRWSGKDIELRMLNEGRDYELTSDTPKDAYLQDGLEKILKKWAWRRYNVAILDITDPAHPRFAGVNEHAAQTPGSVAKILVAAGMLEQLRQRFPDDVAKREELLRGHSVSADDWAKNDSHEVPIVWGENLEKVSIRKLHTGDTFTLWEWMDHALSPSNNSAASTTWREATLMKLMGDTYPPEKYGRELWQRWDRATISQASFDVVDKPLIDAGIDPELFRLRLYFTSGANKYIKSGPSRTTPYAVVKWMLRVEQGRLVDEFSSLELKKMLYLTRRRVRYLYTKKLDNYGAWFKSGSLYRFSEKAERIQYQGDIINVLNALIEIDTTPPPPEPIPKVDEPKGADKQEAPPAADGTTQTPPAPPHVYIVAVMSNELTRNAAIDHSRLAEAVHELITSEPPPVKDAPDGSAAP